MTNSVPIQTRTNIPSHQTEYSSEFNEVLVNDKEEILTDQSSNKTKNPLHEDIELTVLAPMYNEADNVEHTVNSILNTLKGFEKPWELIFVNDASTDNTLDVARGWEQRVENLRVISYPVNCGRGKALKTGFDHACGKYIERTHK